MTFFNQYKNIAIGALISLVSWFSLASTSALVKLMGHTLHSTQVLFCQSVFGVMVITLIYLFNKKNNSLIFAKRYDLLFLRSLAGVSAFFFIFIAVKHVPVADATLLMNTGPFFLPFLLLFFFKEPINYRLWLGIVPGFIGILFILKPGTEIFQWYTLFPLLSGVCVAVILICLRRLYLHGEPIIRILFYLFFFAAVVTLPFAAYYWKMPSYSEWGLLLAIGVASFFSQSAITLALRFASPKTLAPLCYTSVVFALIFDRVIWGIVPGMLSILGMILVIVGGIIALTIENQKSA